VSDSVPLEMPNECLMVVEKHTTNEALGMNQELESPKDLTEFVLERDCSVRTVIL